MNKKPKIKAPVYKKNNEIFSNELRVVDESGKNLGIMSKNEAISLALEKGLDLIEITTTTTPPIAKIESYDKFRYQKEKEFKKQQQAKTQVKELKQIRINFTSARNDLLIKARQADKFLSDGHQIEVVMKIKGRAKGNQAFAINKTEEFLDLIGVGFKIINPIKFGGVGLTLQIDKNDKKNAQ